MSRTNRLSAVAKLPAAGQSFIAQANVRLGFLALAFLVVSSGALLSQDLEGHKKKLWDLQPKIDKAIDTGVEYLLSLQQRDGSWSFLKDQFPNGQTALAVYTLLKCDFPANHPAVLRGLAYLDLRPPQETYSLACQVMALQAAGVPGSKKKIEVLIRKLLSWQQKGSWGYPKWRSDLSNSQYAALAMRAAHYAGIKIPKKKLVALIRSTLENQQSPKSFKQPDPPKGVEPKVTRDSYGRTPSGLEYDRTLAPRKVAGFFYEKSSLKTPTGSMTTAGLGVILICSQILGEKMPKATRRSINSSLRYALNWFRRNWSVIKNPGMRAQHHHYYLYGLERIGSLLGEEILADHPWYFEGARWLVTNQQADGSWVDREGNPFLPPNSNTPHTEHVTCFALLFLKRATRGGGSTGDTTKRRGFKTYAAVADEYPVSLRATGDATISIWISQFGKDVITAHKKAGGLRVSKVEYFVDGTLAGTVAGNPALVWKSEKFPFKHSFKKPGTFKITAKVYALPPGADHESKVEALVLEAPGFNAEIDAVVQNWMISDAKAPGQNLLHPFTKRDDLDPTVAPRPKKKKKYKVTSSSRRGDDIEALAFDGDQGTRWLTQDRDAKAWVMLKLSKGIKTGSIRISQACRNAKETKDFDRITQIEIEINGGKKPISLTLAENVMASTVYTLAKPTKIKSLRVRITGRRPSEVNPGCAGFAEIALER